MDKDNIYACSEILRKLSVEISARAFTEIAPGEQDFVYADPPYDETFTGYSAGRFVGSDQTELRDTALRWHEAGAYVMISNSDTPNIRKLYSKPPFNITEVYASRMVNSNAAGRGAVKELVIRNYK